MSLSDLKPELISLGGSVLLLVLGYLFQARPRLVWGTTHGFTFLVAAQPEQAPTLNIHTASLIVQNFSWRVPATEVEITFNFQPQTWNIWPVRPFERISIPDGRFTLKFSNLAPHEHFQIELLSNGNLPAILSVRSKEIVGKQVKTRFVRVYPKWVHAATYALLLLGIAETIGIALKLFHLT